MPILRTGLIATGLFVLLCAGLAIPHTAAGQAGEPFLATLDKAKGDVTRRIADGNWQEAQLRATLGSGDRIRTGLGSRAVIRYTDETKLVLRASMEALIEGRRGVHVEQGHVAFDVEPQAAEQFRFTSPTAVATIRGTAGAWLVDAAGISELYILSGAATLANSATGETVDVLAGQVGTLDGQGNLTVRSLTASDRQQLRNVWSDFFTPSIYGGARTGFNIYGGDRDLNASNDVSEFLGDIGFSFGVEGGYAFSNHWGVSMMLLLGNYTRINSPIVATTYPVIDPNTTSAWRSHLNTLVRYAVLPQKRFSPYAQAGVHLSFGRINDSIKTGFGPVVGLGIETEVAGGVSLFLEYLTMVVLDDNAIDLADPGGSADVTDTDALSMYSFGVRKKLRLFSPRLR